MKKKKAVGYQQNCCFLFFNRLYSHIYSYSKQNKKGKFAQKVLLLVCKSFTSFVSSICDWRGEAVEMRTEMSKPRGLIRAIGGWVWFWIWQKKLLDKRGIHKNIKMQELDIVKRKIGFLLEYFGKIVPLSKDTKSCL